MRGYIYIILDMKVRIPTHWCRHGSDVGSIKESTTAGARDRTGFMLAPVLPNWVC